MGSVFILACIWLYVQVHIEILVLWECAGVMVTQCCVYVLVSVVCIRVRKRSYKEKNHVYIYNILYYMYIYCVKKKICVYPSLHICSNLIIYVSQKTLYIGVIYIWRSALMEIRGPCWLDSGGCWLTCSNLRIDLGAEVSGGPSEVGLLWPWVWNWIVVVFLSVVGK